MARKRSRSPFPVTPAAFADRFTLPSFLSPLRRSIRSFPLLGGVSRRCNLRLNCQSTGYYFPVSLPGRSGRLGAEPARWPLGKDGTRPVEKTSTGRGRLSILAFFFSLNRRGGSRAFCLRHITIVLLSITFLFFRKLRERKDQGFSMIVDFVDCDKIPT